MSDADTEERTGAASPKPVRTFRPLPSWSACVFFLASFGLLLATAPRWDFVSRGEAREALVVQAMVHQNNLVLPLRNGVDVPSKPPLFHWCALGFEKLVGQPELALRLPSIFAAALLPILLYAFAIPAVGHGTALLAAFFLFSTVEFLRAATVARVDMTFALWVCSALFALGEVVTSYAKNRTKNIRALALASLAMVLGTLAKGPAALFFPWAVAGMTMLILVPVREIPWKLAIVSAVLTAAIGSVWYLAAYSLGGRAFVEMQLMRENVARVVGLDDYQTGHSGAFYMPFVLLLLSLVPLTPLVVLLPRRALAFARTAERPFYVYLTVWAIFFPLFFSFTASQRSVYLLQSLPAWVLLLAIALKSVPSHTEAGNPRAKRAVALLFQCLSGAIVIAVAAAFVLLAIPSIVNLFPLKDSDLDLARAVRGGILRSIPAIAAFLVAGILAWKAFREARKSLFLETAVLLCCGTILIQAGVLRAALPAIAERTSPARFMREAVALADLRGVPLYQYNDDFYAANYYAFRDLPRLNSDAPRPGGSVLLVLRLQQLEQAKQQFPELSLVLTSTERNVYGKDRFALAEIAPVG